MDPNQMMMPRPRSFPMWPPTSSDAMPPPPQLPFLPPPNRGWKRKNPNPNPNSNSAAYQPPAIGDLQVQNRAKARRWFKPNNNNTNRRPFFHKPKAKAPRNTSSFIIRAKRAGGIAPLVSPSPVTPAVLPTPVISPAHDERLLSDVLAQQQWGVDGYGSMKGLIRLRLANHAPSSSDDDDSSGSDVEEHVEVERRLDHDLSRFEMVYPQPGAVFEDNDELCDQNQQDDVDVHVARLEEENLTLKERLFLVEQEVGDMRRRLEAIEARFSDAALANAAAAAAAVENGTEVGNAAIAAAAGADDAVEQALENGNDAVEVVALQNGTGSGAVNDTVEEALKNDTEMGDATADADNTFEDSTEKGDASDNGRANKSLENGSVEPEKSGKEEESYSAGSEKNAEIGDAPSAQGNGQEA
ncbi:hypothetical protein QYE76_054553 [Lolium multiflorum]|uniref:PRLI-interacting factor A n=1 Tax=Lolium multiflorum TaxID=4521 RepID=A0AAD8SYJ0_LOLMU|nr:hypothetical protein QYE76_054553 [Lolium multiflorum]